MGSESVLDKLAGPFHDQLADPKKKLPPCADSLIEAFQKRAQEPQ
jgi:hypothetical protein